MSGEVIVFCQGFLVVFIFIMVGAFKYYTDKGNRVNIKRDLQEENATDIEITTVWFDADRDTRTYNVAYTDEEGQHHHTSCKIRNRLWESEIEIYWKHPF